MSLFSIIRFNKAILFLAGLAGAAVVFFLLVAFSRDFTVQTDYLVIQQSAETQDFYTLSKSVEYSGNILKEAIASDLFFSEAAKTNYFNAAAFPTDEGERQKAWQKSIAVSQKSAAGILEVTVKRPSSTEAKGIARAISEVLINENALFRSGTKDSMTIKVISGPIVEQNPTLKTMIFSIIAGAIFGMANLLLWIFSRLRRRQ
ncbi:MAG: hypothetical protein WCG84_04325 [Candidatus Moraniibacteriota bacterium]